MYSVIQPIVSGWNTENQKLTSLALQKLLQFLPQTQFTCSPFIPILNLLVNIEANGKGKKYDGHEMGIEIEMVYLGRTDILKARPKDKLDKLVCHGWNHWFIRYDVII